MWFKKFWETLKTERILRGLEDKRDAESDEKRRQDQLKKEKEEAELEQKIIKKLIAENTKTPSFSKPKKYPSTGRGGKKGAAYRDTGTS